MNSRERQAAIARCEEIMAKAGLASLIIASDYEGHSFGLQTPPGSAFIMLGADDVALDEVALLNDASPDQMDRERTRLGGLWLGAGSMVQSVEKLLRIATEKMQRR